MDVSEFKNLAQELSLKSLKFVYRPEMNIDFLKESIGAPSAVFNFKRQGFMLAFTNDGIGRKIKVADFLKNSCSSEMPRKNSFRPYKRLGADLAAMNANDLLCVGAEPLALCLDLNLENDLIDSEQAKEFLEGLEYGLNEAGMWLSGGETASPMKEIICRDSMNISGAAIGIIKPKKNLLLGDKIKKGDVIIELASSGLHSNGHGKTKEIIGKFHNENLFKIRLSDGWLMYFDLLQPTKIYVERMKKIFKSKIEIHYVSHITGGGWKKIIRAGKHYPYKNNFTYVIEELPPLQPIFEFLQKRGDIPDKEAYGTWNMGIGMVVIAPESSFAGIKEICESKYILSPFDKIKTYYLGRVEEGLNQVIIKPKNITLS